MQDFSNRPSPAKALRSTSRTTERPIPRARYAPIAVSRSPRRFRESPLAQQGVRRRQSPAESLVGFAGIARVASSEDVVAQPRGGRRIEHVAGLLEGLKGVRVQ